MNVRCLQSYHQIKYHVHLLQVLLAAAQFMGLMVLENIIPIVVDS